MRDPVERLLTFVHRKLHGHDPVWDCRFDGLGREWFCAECRFTRRTR